MSFVRGANPVWFFANITAQPFDDTYWAFFYENDNPTVLQAVYKEPDGTNTWANPIEFQASSGLPDNIFGNPDVAYRIEFRNGSSPSAPLIYLVENYFFGGGGGGGSASVNDPLLIASNMITNPNFSDVFFSSPLTITTAGNYDIAPGWQLRLTGTGTITISQNTNSGSSHNPVDSPYPPYYLSLSDGTWDSVQLVQRFNNNGAIFEGGAASIAFTAGVSVPPGVITVSYAPSTSSVQTVLFPFPSPVPISSSLPKEYKNAVNIPNSTNTDVGMNSYVDIIFNLPTSGITNLTNIQLTGQNTPLSTPTFIAPSFAQQTYERIVDQEFHVYKDSLVTQPKNNLLVGWTFALNPYQFVTTAITSVSNFGYVADQTIIIPQQWSSGSAPVGNSVSTGQGTSLQNYAFTVKANTANNQFAIIQYIDTATIAPYWDQILSAMINARLSSSNSTPVKFKVRLISRETAIPTIATNEPIASWTLSGEPVFATGWNPIPSLNDPIYTLTSDNQNFPFDQFALTIAPTDTMYLGIVIYTVSNLDINNSVLFNRVSFVPNDFAIDASTETWDETLRKCQYYYEKSYSNFTLPGTITPVGSNNSVCVVTVGVPTDTAHASSFYLRFKQTKRTNPSITFYSPSNGAADSVNVIIFHGSQFPPATSSAVVSLSSIWTFNYPGSTSTLSEDGVQLITNNTNVLAGILNSLGGSSAMTTYHYTCDARLGIVP
jgi:hypothetical protein